MSKVIHFGGLVSSVECSQVTSPHSARSCVTVGRDLVEWGAAARVEMCVCSMDRVDPSMNMA